LYQEQYQQHINDFFRLYEQFLLVDSIISILSDGRDRDIVVRFLLYFTDIVNKKESKILNHKEEVKKILKGYIVQNDLTKNRCYSFHSSNYYISVISQRINNDLNSSFKAFLKASELYEMHRQKLTQQEIISVYRRNALDYYLTAFGVETQDEFKVFLVSYTASKQVNGVRLLKQSLMEFNNAISHLYSAWKKKSIDTNMERAQHHLNRGALDFYKSIIKELSMLNKINTSNLDELKNLRCLEYSSIGEERHKGTVKPLSLYDEYYKFCLETINN